MEQWATDYCEYLNQRQQPIEQPAADTAPMAPGAAQPGKKSRNVLSLFCLVVFELIWWLYRVFTRKAYHISGTFIDQIGVRRFFTTSFCTYGNIMPILSLTNQLKAHYQAQSLVILHFNRIPYGMVKYMTAVYNDPIKLTGVTENK